VKIFLPSRDSATFLGWLGTVTEYDPQAGQRWDDEETRQEFSQFFAQQAAKDPALYAQIVAFLDAPAWLLRCGAAMTLIAMPQGPPPVLLPRLRHLLDDHRDETSWPHRLTIAQVLINDPDRTLSDRAIEVCLQALDYATQPWYHLPTSGPAVRKQAATILGQLEPLYRNDRIFQRLARLMAEDSDGAVRDAAYGALIRLAAAPEEVVVLEGVEGCR